MNVYLSNAYSLCIAISFELNDVSYHKINLNEVNAVEVIMFSLVTYYPNILAIFEILMFARKMGA